MPRAGEGEEVVREKLVYAVDYETYYDSKYSLKKMPVWAYVWHPTLFNAYMVAVAGSDGFRWVGRPEEFNWAMLNGQVVIHHNAQFDALVTERLQLENKIPAFAPSAVHDTADLAAFLKLPRALGDINKFVYRDHGVSLAKEKARLKMLGKSSAELMADPEILAYAASDAVGCLRVWTDWSDLWPEEEREFSRLNREACRRGVEVDLPYVEKCISGLNMRLFAASRAIPWKWAEGKTPLARAKMIEQAQKSVDEERPLSEEERLLVSTLDLGDPQQAAGIATKALNELWGSSDERNRRCELFTREDGTPCVRIFMWYPTSFAQDDEECTAWEDEYGDRPGFEWLGAVRDWRRMNVLLKKFVHLRDNVGEDGRFHYQKKYFGAHCVPAGTEVLTPEGWVRIEDWRGGDIMQWDGRDLSLSFRPAIAHSFYSDDNLLAIEAPYVKGVFTLGHTVPTLAQVSFALRPYKAGELAGRAHFMVPTSGIYSSPGAQSIGPEVARLLVAIQADGHWVPEKDGGSVQINVKKARKKERIRSILSELGVEFREKVFPSCPDFTRFVIPKRNLPRGVSRDKKLFGPWLFELSSSAVVAAAEELGHWDGSIAAGGGVAYYTAVKSNAEWAATLCHLAGRIATVFVKKPGHGTKTQNATYVVTVKPRHYAMVFNRHMRVTGHGGGDVYCPETKTGYWLYRYNGVIGVTGNTGRFSGDGRFNMENLPREEMFCESHPEGAKDDKGRDVSGKPIKGTGFDLRRCFIGDLAILDYRQVEARVELALVKDEDALVPIRAGVSTYESYARAKLGWTGGDLKEAGETDPAANRLYRLSKACVLGGGYGCGGEKFADTARKMAGLKMTVDEGKLRVAEFRASNPKIVAFWARMDEVVRRACFMQEEVMQVRLSSGRILNYWRPRARTVRRVVKTETGDKVVERTAFFTQVAKGDNSSYRKTYGANLVENIAQAIARDILRDAWIALARAGYVVLCTVHDEFIIDLQDGQTVDEAEEIILRAGRESWAAFIPLALEKKTSKFFTK